MVRACCPHGDRRPSAALRPLGLAICAVIAAIVAAAVAGGAAAGDSAGGADSPAESRAAELAAIRVEIGKLQQRLGTMRARETGAEAELRRLEVELALQQSQLEEATAAHQLAAARAADAERRIGELEIALAAVRDDLRRRLGGLYHLGRQGYLRLFLSLEPDQRLLSSIRQLRFLVRRDQRLLDRYEETRTALEDQQVVLAEQQQEMAAWKAAEAERHQALRAMRTRQARLLARLARERRTLAEQAEALEEKARRLGSFIRTLVGDSPSPLAGRPIQDFEGVLDWPAEGRVAVGFGPRKDPRYRTEVPHNGVRLSTVPGAEVRAIYPGEVLYADRFEGYGRMVVVHHPGRVFTLSTGLATLRVQKGDMVSLGDVVGTAADSLYFELRHDSQPEDPTRWLR